MIQKPGDFVVIKGYQTPYPDSILFKEGERVIIGETFQDDPDWVDWIWCAGESENRAWVPKQYIQLTSGEWRLSRDYDAKELSINIGEILAVDQIINGFGMAVKSDSTKGWVPLKNLQWVDGA